MNTKEILLSILLLIGVCAPASARSIKEIKESSSKSSIDTLRSVKTLYSSMAKRQKSISAFTEEVQCTARMVGESYWAISEWLAGDEIYKVYQDVDLLGNDCAYPFYVSAVAIELEVEAGGTIYLQADVEALDPEVSTPACPYPGDVLGLTEDQDFVIPDAGYYLLMVIFPEPVLVEGPYFAGIYFSAEVGDLGGALITDNDPYQCISWNDWGLGYVDLVSNSYFDFPGNLVMYSLGYNGTAQSSAPPVKIYSPADSSSQSASVQVYAAELVDTIAVDRCRFEYYSQGSWTTIGEDTSPDVTKRNSVSQASIQPGFSTTWNTSGLGEGWYMLRSTLLESTDNYTSDTIDVFIDNTPLNPLVTKPLNASAVCDTVTLTTTIPDEDVTFVQFELRLSDDTIRAAMPLLNQQRYGDVDGDTLDGNWVAQGEFGDYYNGPTAATSLYSYFATRGYPDLMKIGTSTQTVRKMVEATADSARVRLQLGSCDDNLLSSVRDHLKRQGNSFRMSVLSGATLKDLIYYMGYHRGTVLLGISQPYGHWLPVTRLMLPPDETGAAQCIIYETRGGSELESSLLFSPNLSVRYQGLMRAVDRVVAIYPRADTTSREVVGGDFTGSNGWSYMWDASSYAERPYIVAAIGADLGGHFGEGISWFTRECAPSYIVGDVNYSGYIDIDDIVYLINYVFGGGPEPMPELAAGYASCDQSVDIDDIVYLINYVFQGGPEPPCQP
jgi:hypothetical protein